MEDNNWFVANDSGQVAGHDMTEDRARQCAREMQEREPNAGWEAIQEDVQDDVSTLRSFLKANGLTQSEAAEIIGVSPKAVQSWCQGVRGVPRYAFKVLSYWCGSVQDKAVK